MNFRDNVAHSVTGSGAHIYGQPGQDCYEGSHFSAYKCSVLGLGAHFKQSEIRMSHMTLIDNAISVSIQVGKDGDKCLTKLEDSHIYGEAPALDCPSGANDCFCTEKIGFLLFGGNEGGKTLHIEMASSRPHQKIKSSGAWNAATDIKSVTF